MYNFWYSWLKPRSTNFLNKEMYVDDLVFIISNCCSNNKKKKYHTKNNYIKKNRTRMNCFYLLNSFCIYSIFLLDVQIPSTKSSQKRFQCEFFCIQWTWSDFYSKMNAISCFIIKKIGSVSQLIFFIINCFFVNKYFGSDFELKLKI